MRYLQLSLFASVIFVIVSTFVAVSKSSSSPLASLPIYGSLEPFELKDQENRSVTRETLKGAVHVINFIFTSCSETCPLLTRQMAKIARRTEALGPKVKLISISVNPEHDTPWRLKTYGMEHGADFSRWSFLTGSLDAIRRVVGKSFMTAMKLPSDATDLMEIVHGENFVLIDEAARIRAFRRAENDSQVGVIVDNVRQLVAKR